MKPELEKTEQTVDTGQPESSVETPQTEVVEEPQAEVVEEPQAEAVEEPQAEAVETPQVESVEEPQAESAAESVEEPLTVEEETAKPEENVSQEEGNAPAEEESTPAETKVQAGAEAETEAETKAEAETEEAPKKKIYTSKAEVIERIKELAHGDETPTKEEVELLKTVFYKLHFAEREAQLQAFKDAGGNVENFKPVPDEDEEEYKAEMIIIKEKRARIAREQEAEKERNLNRKLEIIEKIKAMITSPEDANKSFREFKALQQEWKEIRNIPLAKANELWRNYQLYVEQYYDLLKLNNEAREYDFKKNLEAKTKLCEAAEKLAEEEDLVSAFRQLQKLHQEYRETGPIARELREEMWARFKAASTVVNKRHQQHFEGIRAKEEENLAKKTELCEKIEAIAAEENKGSGDWEKHTKQIIALQAEWKTIGFAPQKMNVKIFERFRAACDDFFSRKAEYFRNMKGTIKENIEKKRALIEKANELKDSTDWKATSDKMIALQKEWKTIGIVSRKVGDQLWEEFIGACNHFFEARNAATSGQRGSEGANMARKRAIIKQLKALTADDDNVQATAQQLCDEYSTIGHVPYREKDKVQSEFREAVERLDKELGVSVTTGRRGGARGRGRTMERADDGLGEREKLMRQYENLKAEMQTYDNNIGFLSATSKKGNTLIDSMNKKVQKLKDELEAVKQKIKALDAANEEADGEE